MEFFFGIFFGNFLFTRFLQIMTICLVGIISPIYIDVSKTCACAKRELNHFWMFLLFSNASYLYVILPKTKNSLFCYFKILTNSVDVFLKISIWFPNNETHTSRNTYTYVLYYNVYNTIKVSISSGDVC